METKGAEYNADIVCSNFAHNTLDLAGYCANTDHHQRLLKEDLCRHVTNAAERHPTFDGFDDGRVYVYSQQIAVSSEGNECCEGWIADQ